MKGGEPMLKIIGKIILAVILLRIITMVGLVAHGPMKAIIIIALLVLGARMVFSKNTDKD